MARSSTFTGTEPATGGRIIRPKDIILEAPGGSSLSVTGGRSVARLSQAAFDEFFSIESASTFAEGLFDDANQYRDKTLHRAQEDALTATTTVRAEVSGDTEKIAGVIRLRTGTESNGFAAAWPGLGP